VVPGMNGTGSTVGVNSFGYVLTDSTTSAPAVLTFNTGTVVLIVLLRWRRRKCMCCEDQFLLLAGAHIV
jgi:hypothetical protein